MSRSAESSRRRPPRSSCRRPARARGRRRRRAQPRRRQARSQPAASPTSTGRQRRRRQRQHLLGEQQQRVPAVAPGRPRLRGQRQPDRPQAAAGRRWQTRTQTLTVQGSTNGSTFATLKASAGYAFNPASRQHRHHRLHRGHRPVRAAEHHRQHRLARRVSSPSSRCTARRPATPQAPSAPSSLAFTQPASGQIRLTWNASTDNVGVTGYDIYANGALRTSVRQRPDLHRHASRTAPPSPTTCGPRTPPATSSGNSNTVTRTGQGGDTQAPTAPGNLSYTQPAAGQIRLAWTASTDNVGVTGYDVYANGSLQDQRRRQRADLHRQPAGHRDRVLLRPGAGRGRQRVGGQQHGHPDRHRRSRRHEPGGGQADRRRRRPCSPSSPPTPTTTTWRPTGRAARTRRP